MHDKEGMVDNQKQQKCEGNTNHITAAPQGSAIQRQNIEMLEDIIRQSENQTHQVKDFSYAKARHETPTDDMKTSTQCNNGPKQSVAIQLIQI